MALDDLLHAIEVEADDEAGVIVLDAERQARTLLDGARADAADVERAPLCEQEPRLQAEASGRVSAARADGARRRATAREDAFTQTLARVEDRLAAARKDEGWARTLGALIDEAFAVLPSETVVTVHTDPRDAVLVEAHLARRGAAIPVVADLTSLGGVVAATADGRRADNTFEARLATSETRLRQRFTAAAIGEER